ncbi:tyrosine-protein phosphatase [Enemella sp. A6]|uniref:tyrosine-protein phosphatase n=1 Tax=Enemella sp. A6 TaxID=3440152 RepID=UPI003EBCB375
MTVNWIELDGLVNLRDVGGTPTVDGGQIRSGRLLRSDNLQDLSSADIERLLQIGLTDVVDLRSTFEVTSEGPGPLHAHDGRVNFHHYSFLVEEDSDTADDIIDRAMPTHDVDELRSKIDDHFAASYVGFLHKRPESVLGALRAIAHADGAALVHCAAGKDRTGITVAMALMLAGADRQAVVDDYAASRERMEQIVARLRSTETYAHLHHEPVSSHMTHPESMDAFLGFLEDAHGGVEPALSAIGWTPADTEAMRRHLRD